MKWYEWTSKRPAKEDWQTLQSAIAEFNPSAWYYFLDEPWSPWVVRFQTDKHIDALPILAQGKWNEWDHSEDEERFGPAYPSIVHMFQSAAEVGRFLALAENDEQNKLEWLSAVKIIHCVMNAWGFNVYEEAKLYHSMYENRLGLLLSGIGTHKKKKTHQQAVRDYLINPVGRMGKFRWYP